MQILNRLVGALLLLTAAIVGIYFVVDQLEVLPFLWGELDYLMALALVLGLIFASMRKRSLESAGLDRIVTRRYFEANLLFYGFVAMAMLFFWNWFDLLVDADPQDTDHNIVWIIVDTVAPLLWGALGIFLLRGGKDD